MPDAVSEYIDGAIYSTSVSYNNPLTDNRSVLKFLYTANSSSAVGYLDYFEITYQKELKAVSDYLLFFSKDTTAVINYQLSNFSNSSIRVFDVSDFSGMKEVTGASISGGDFNFQSAELQNRVSKYIAIANNNYKTPVNPEEIPNSNLHGIADGAKFIIITHKNFIDAANRLKNFRENEAMK